MPKRNAIKRHDNVVCGDGESCEISCDQLKVVVVSDSKKLKV